MERTPTVALAIASLIAAAFVTSSPVAADTQAEARTELCEAATPDSFQDVAGVHATNVACLVAFGISRGTTANTFDPHGPLRRAHLATLLTNFLTLATGDSLAAPSANPFNDVAGSVHADNIAIAAANGLTKGVTATQFAPQRLVTRAQFATMVTNTLDAAGHPLPVPTANAFTDISGNVHAANIQRLATAGIVSGATPNRFDPHQPVSRQQAATLLIHTAAELHRAELWDAGTLANQDDTNAGATSDLAALSQIAINGTQLDDAATNPTNVDPLIITGTASTTESTIQNVQVRIDTGTWITATAASGQFDSDKEPFRVVLQDIPDGTRTLDIRAIDADGLSSEIATFTLDVAKPVAASLQAAVTDPTQNRILLTFDQDVSCVDSPEARAAWQFVNASQHAPVAGQAAGAPDTISPLPGQPTECALNYNTSGIRVSDFGTISYTRPDPEHAVRSGDGQLKNATASDVEDSTEPTFLSVSANTAVDAKRVVLEFNKPIRCADITSTTFLLSVDSANRSSEIETVGCSEDSELVSLHLTGSDIEPGHSLNVSVFTDVFSASGYGQVEFGAQRTGTAT